MMPKCSYGPSSKGAARKTRPTKFARRNCHHNRHQLNRPRNLTFIHRLSELHNLPLARTLPVPRRTLLNQLHLASARRVLPNRRQRLEEVVEDVVCL